MCEFKIIRENDGSQIAEDVLVLTYTEENELFLRDILGSGDILDSALILDVNTVNQTSRIIEHPIIKPFIKMMKNLIDGSVEEDTIENIKKELTKIENSM
jgi:predicted RNA-binding protein